MISKTPVPVEVEQQNNRGIIFTAFNNLVKIEPQKLYGGEGGGREVEQPKYVKPGC